MAIPTKVNAWISNNCADFHLTFIPFKTIDGELWSDEETLFNSCGALREHVNVAAHMVPPLNIRSYFLKDSEFETALVE